MGSSPITRSRIKLFFLLFVCLLTGCATRGHIAGQQTDTGKSGTEAVGIYHKVKNGETLWRISQAYGVSVNDIVRSNKLPNASIIEEGQLLYIPGKKTTVNIPSKSASNTYEGFNWPVNGKVISLFGTKWDGGRNKGIDIESKEGQVVVASKAGKVIFCSDSLKGYGRTVIIEHEDGFSSVYAHNKEILVRPGDKVTSGQAVSVIGSTGRVSLPRLHFEIRKGHEPQNPLYYLP